MIIAYIGTDCKSYEEESPKIYQTEWLCKDCQCRAHIHCTYVRKVIEKNIDGKEKVTVEEIIIVRVKCTSESCGKTHAIIPDFLCPYKRYKAEEIAEAIELYEETGSIEESNTSADESTISRWIGQYLSKIDVITTALERIIFKENDKQVSLIDYAVKGMKRIKIIIGKYKNLVHSSIIGFINQILSSNGLKIFL